MAFRKSVSLICAIYLPNLPLPQPTGLPVLPSNHSSSLPVSILNLPTVNKTYKKIFRE